MLQYLQIKSHHASKNKFIVFRERKKKFDKKVKETYISKKDSIIILGLGASGKTKEIKKVWTARKTIWAKDTFIWLSATDSISEWFHINLRDKDSLEYLEQNNDEYSEHGMNLNKDINKQYIKMQILTAKAKGAIVFIDDIEKLNGKKLEIAKDIMRDAKLYYVTTSNEHIINKTIQNAMKKKKYKEIDLRTEASYDITNFLIASFIVSLFVSGQYELAMLVMATKYMTKGKSK